MADLDKFLSVAEVVAYRHALGHSCTAAAVHIALRTGSLTGTQRAGRWFVHVDDLRGWLAAKAETIRAAQLGVSHRVPASGAPDYEAET